MWGEREIAEAIGRRVVISMVYIDNHRKECVLPTGSSEQCKGTQYHEILVQAASCLGVSKKEGQISFDETQ